MDRLTAWRAVERFFVEFFGFLFDNTSWCYLVVAYLFPYFCALLLLFVVHVNALEWFYWFITFHLLLFRTKINESKSNRAVILIEGLNKFLYFHTNSSFQKPFQPTNTTIS